MTGIRASLAESAAHLMIIHNARVLTFDSANRVLDSGTVEILPDGSIGQVKETSAGAERELCGRQPSSPLENFARAAVASEPTRKSSTRRASF